MHFIFRPARKKGIGSPDVIAVCRPAPCDVFFQHEITNSIGLEDDIVNKANTGVSLGVGIRVLEGDQTGYSYSEDLTPEAMTLAAKTASNIA
ncbi:MAG: hypothetical protein MUP31_08280, partial [Xanthomonadales bacterium]|nr:hypothetical protein [Xanthomonadales bacterium]